MKSIRRRTQNRSSQPEIILTSFIDTIMVLLIVFMVTTPLVHNAITVELPHGAVQEVQVGNEDMVLYWDQGGTIFFNGARVTKQTIIKTIAQRIEKQPQAILFVQADRNVPYGTIIEFIDTLKEKAGVKYVALETQQTHDKKHMDA